MGDVAISLRVMPDSPETNLDNIREEISKIVKIEDSKIEPVAFGIKALKILVLTPDKGGTDELEAKIKSIKGVAEVEVESVTLI